MKILLIVLVMLAQAKRGLGQLYMSKTAEVSFHSHTWLENIDAVNNNVRAAIDLGKKNIAFTMYMSEFSFKKKLMQEHFNENYVESDKFPKASFYGNYSEPVDLTKDGSYPLTVKGKITLHGVTRELTASAILTIRNGTLTGTSTFKLNPADFDITIPFIVRDKIEKENTVKVKAEWQPVLQK